MTNRRHSYKEKKTKTGNEQKVTKWPKQKKGCQTDSKVAKCLSQGIKSKIK